MEYTKTVMPVLFIGHGTPMNAIENNEFSLEWKRLGEILPRPKAILCISAHWETEGTQASATDTPKTIHDFGGFPRELYNQQYPAPGLPELAETIHNELDKYFIGRDYIRGLDHGAWSFLKHMYPDADIPVVQLSIDYSQDMQFHYNLGKELSFLREAGVLITGSGNMIHNLMLARAGANGFNTEFAYDWAIELNKLLKEKILSNDHNSLIHYSQISNARLGIPSEEHYIPLVYTLALQRDEDKITVFNDKIVGGSISMTSLIIGN